MCSCRPKDCGAGEAPDCQLWRARSLPYIHAGRAPTACEEGEWVFDDAYENATGGYVPSMQGNPLDNVAEVTCRLADDGEYTLTAAQLEEALTYARRVGAEGAVFYFARSTETEAVVPAVKNQFDQRLEISPIKLTSRAVDIGRFWFDPDAVE